MIDAAGLWRRALHPQAGFAELAAAPPPLGRSVARMLALRLPVAYLAWTVAVLKFTAAYTAFRAMDGFVWQQVLPRLGDLGPGLRIEEIRTFLEQLPSLPGLGVLLAWGLLAAPLGVVGAWMHDAVWDHGCLWMLGGLKGGGRFRTTLLSTTEAFSVAVLGALVALLGEIPLLGLILGLPLAALGLYFWILRGFALAAFHRVPLWKGIGATVLHLVLAGCCLLALGAFLALALLAPVA